jgi:hypothetical protein
MSNDFTPSVFSTERDKKNEKLDRINGIVEPNACDREHHNRQSLVGCAPPSFGGGRGKARDAEN